MLTATIASEVFVLVDDDIPVSNGNLIGQYPVNSACCIWTQSSNLPGNTVQAGTVRILLVDSKVVGILRRVLEVHRVTGHGDTLGRTDSSAEMMLNQTVSDEAGWVETDFYRNKNLMRFIRD